MLEPTKIPHRQVCTKAVNSQLLFQEISYNQQDRDFILNCTNSRDRNSNLKLNHNQLTRCSNVLKSGNLQFENDDHIYGNISSSSLASISRSTICIQNHSNKECCEENTNNHKQLIEQISQEKPMEGPVYSMLNLKPKKLKRRATISGSIFTQSPTSLHAPIRIEDLVNLNNTENYYLNKNKSIKTSNLNLENSQAAAKQQDANFLTTNLYKSFNNLSTADYLSYDDQLELIIKRKPNLNKRTCSEDDAQFKKRTVSVCYNEKYGVNNEFFKQNYLSLPQNQDKLRSENEMNAQEFDRSLNEVNRDEAKNDCYFIRNKHNNATVIKVNSTNSSLISNKLSNTKVNKVTSRSSCSSDSDQYSNFDQVNENFDHQFDCELNKLNSIQIATEHNKNIVHVLGDSSLENEEMETKFKGQNKQINQQYAFNVDVSKSSSSSKEDNLKIDKEPNYLTTRFSNKQDVPVKQTKSKHQEEDCNSTTKASSEVLKRKKSLNKQAKCE